MDRERRERAKSIRAARDWLAGAEDALAGEDDLAGDLKLMLARAELARIAANRRARLRRWAGWVLPPLAAAAVWAWMAWNPAPLREEAAIPPPITVPAQTETYAVEHSVIAAAPHEEMMPASEEAPAQHAAPPPQQAAEPSVPASPEASAPATQNVLSRMPDTDMQRLMQVGGKILRE